MQNAQQASFSVAINEKNFSSKADRGYINGTGSIIDDVAYALGLWTWEDCEQAHNGYIAEVVMNIINAFSWEKFTRDQLNANKELNAIPEIAASEYLAGDWYEINEPHTFAAHVARERAEAEESLSECFPFNHDAGAPLELLEKLSSNVDSEYDNLRHEWLYGDYRSIGTLDRISRYFTGKTGNVRMVGDESESALSIDFTESEAREYLAYEIGEDELVTSEILTENITRHLLARVATRHKETAERQKKLQDIWKAQQEAQNAKLEAKKEEARKRKQEAK